jgi:hypothetical protein
MLVFACGLTTPPSRKRAFSPLVIRSSSRAGSVSGKPRETLSPMASELSGAGTARSICSVRLACSYLRRISCVQLDCMPSLYDEDAIAAGELYCKRKFRSNGIFSRIARESRIAVYQETLLDVSSFHRVSWAALLAAIVQMCNYQMRVCAGMQLLECSKCESANVNRTSDYR